MLQRRGVESERARHLTDEEKKRGEHEDDNDDDDDDGQQQLYDYERIDFIYDFIASSSS